eukprot:TRINITY_DN9500_c0_g1_i1.p1 TRINITY_DN9500_c0_g1~~TRINITY_DN9500_c0_g1_i1.p1  ORF type:complete len:404 (+),score=113.99 TRINITY_DN9500_c0_g1_i1:180-1391(+)
MSKSATPAVMSERDVVEKLRALRRKKSNQLCFDCLQPGPTYVCTSLNIFVCNECAGIHRSFGHRVKNILMASFSPSEIEGIEVGGNLIAKKKWLASWDESVFPRPELGCNPHERIKFMKMVYEEKKWYQQPTVAPKKKKTTIARKLKRSLTESISLSSTSTKSVASRVSSEKATPVSSQTIDEDDNVFDLVDLQHAIETPSHTKEAPQRPPEFLRHSSAPALQYAYAQPYPFVAAPPIYFAYPQQFQMVPVSQPPPPPAMSTNPFDVNQGDDDSDDGNPFVDRPVKNQAVTKHFADVFEKHSKSEISEDRNPFESDEDDDGRNPFEDSEESSVQSQNSSQFQEATSHVYQQPPPFDPRYSTYLAQQQGHQAAGYPFMHPAYGYPQQGMYYAGMGFPNQSSNHL